MMLRQDACNAVQRILKKYKRVRDAAFDPVAFFRLVEADKPDDSSDSGSSSTSELQPPPFEAVVISPSDSPLKVYLGSVSDAMYPAALKEHNIVAILNVAARQCSDVQRIKKISNSESDKILSRWERVEFRESWYSSHLDCPEFRYLTVEAEDHPRYKIVDDFESCFSFLENIEVGPHSNEPCVLIHCMQGLNRSAAVCVGWLIKRFGMSVTEAVEQVASKRNGVLSNRAFAKQIIDWAIPAAQVSSDEKPISRNVIVIGNVIERI